MIAKDMSYFKKVINILKEEGMERNIVDLGQGIKKEILKEGSGPKPEFGKNAKVHYTGRLMDGSVFDSSVSRGQHFVFPLGQGRVIKCWDTGVASMKQGEKAVLTCPPDVAYGSRGAGGVIPPHATLLFEVELF
jgi:FKBP-type peptidyl-prolyl cis-trans isomerase